MQYYVEMSYRPTIMCLSAYMQYVMHANQCQNHAIHNYYSTVHVLYQYCFCGLLDNFSNTAFRCLLLITHWRPSMIAVPLRGS